MMTVMPWTMPSRKTDYILPLNFTLCSSRKYQYSPPQKGLEFPAGWGFSKTKHLKKCIKLNWNFQRGGGRGLGNNNNKKLFCEGSMVFSGPTNFPHLLSTPVGLKTCSNKTCNASSKCQKEIQNIGQHGS